MSTELGPSGRHSVPIKCPYCRHEDFGVCRRPAGYETMHTCRECLGVFLVRFEVTVTARVHAIDGEAERVADASKADDLVRKRKAKKARS
jgi:hypothetical protein